MPSALCSRSQTHTVSGQQMRAVVNIGVYQQFEYVSKANNSVQFVLLLPEATFGYAFLLQITMIQHCDQTKLSDECCPGAPAT